MAMVGDNKTLEFICTMADRTAQYFGRNTSARLEILVEDFQKAYGTAYGVGNKGRNQEFTAVAVNFDPPLDKAADLRRVIWRIDNRAEILDMRTYRSVTLRSKQPITALAVPASAVIHVAAGNRAVFVMDADERLRFRHIETGLEDEQYVEVVSGLSEGDVVITSDHEGLRDGMQATVTLRDAEVNHAGK